MQHDWPVVFCIIHDVVCVFNQQCLAEGQPAEAGCCRNSQRTAALITRLIGHTDVSTWNAILKGRESERVGTHHHSDVLGQVPGAALKEI